ncbi:MAG TPA: hypothetical protein PLO61_01685 [Fimbriimonadaceae bacterium]|nr:hypothetical protein [Fimbriimonadaceae bacterium]HRJ32238.1 hypothetical protein [Fimbriimonadaceae bacterium]
MLNISVGLLVAVAIPLAFWWGVRKATTDPHETSLSVLGTALFTLLGLILAFSFSTAWGRFDRRLELAIDEANAIGTLRLRLAFLSPAAKNQVEPRLLEYVDERIRFNRALSTKGGIERADQAHTQAADRLWVAGFLGAREIQDAPDRALVIQAMNEVFDLADTRRIESRTSMPIPIAVLLALTSLICAYLSGREASGKPASIRRTGWVFAIFIAATVYAVFDVSDPRTGLIQVSHSDVLLLETRSALANSIGRPQGDPPFAR